MRQELKNKGKSSILMHGFWMKIIKRLRWNTWERQKSKSHRWSRYRQRHIICFWFRVWKILIRSFLWQRNNYLPFRAWTSSRCRKFKSRLRSIWANWKTIFSYMPNRKTRLRAEFQRVLFCFHQNIKRHLKTISALMMLRWIIWVWQEASAKS